MEEIRKNNILEIKLEDGSIIRGKVFEYTSDRILVLVEDTFFEKADTLNELDRLYVKANTNYGLKTMYSHVISKLNSRGFLIIENSQAEAVEQKRENVRVVDDFSFLIKINDDILNAKCLNISAGGIAFTCNDYKFNKDDFVKIEFKNDVFNKNITCNAVINKVNDEYYTAKFENLSVYDESAIVQRVFKLLARK